MIINSLWGVNAPLLLRRNILNHGLTMSNTTYEAVCIICNKIKTYSSLSSYKKCKDSPCKSCSNSISRGGNGNVNQVNGYKKCIGCNESKPVSDYHYYNKEKRYHSFCNECKKEKFKHYQKNVGRFLRYDITKDTYEEMYSNQEGKCFLCEQSFEVLCIDHSHKTGQIRKLLCKDCNSALGLLKENLNTVENLKKYIKNYD